MGSRCVGEGNRTQRWIIGEAEWDGIEMQSTLSRIALTALVFSWRALRIEGVLLRMLIPSEAATLSDGGIDAEKTNAVPLIR